MKGFIIRMSSLVAAAALCATAVFASQGAGISADEALQKLMDGSKSYIEGKMGACAATTKETREKLATGQKPYAIILSCSDSRVPPEIIFDKSFGEIFVVRVAGNVADPIILGSVEYAAEHLGSPLIVVLGHERCGAVTATVKAKGKAEGNIGAIVKTIAPAAAKARKEYKGKDEKELVEAATNVNVKMVAASLTKQSKILSHLAKEGKIKIVTAKYDLDDGKVELLK